MKLCYNNDGSLHIKRIRLSPEEIKELQQFLNKIILPSKNKATTKHACKTEAIFEMLQQLHDSGKLKEMTLREVAAQIGSTHPQTAKYYITKFNKR